MVFFFGFPEPRRRPLEMESVTSASPAVWRSPDSLSPNRGVFSCSRQRARGGARRPCADNFHGVDRSVIGVGAREAEPLHRGHSAADASEDGVLAVEVRAWRKRDEELAAVCVGARVRHREDASCERKGQSRQSGEYGQENMVSIVMQHFQEAPAQTRAHTRAHLQCVSTRDGFHPEICRRKWTRRHVQCLSGHRTAP